MNRYALIALSTAVLLVIGCVTQSMNEPGLTAFPDPQEPVWLTAEDIDSMESQVSDDPVEAQDLINQLDFFVLMTATRDENVSRDSALSAAVLLVKYQLHRLFYDVSFDTTLHPFADPDFYGQLAMFEQRAGLEVDGIFTSPEFEKLSFLADLENEQEVRTTLKYVGVVENSLASAEGTWVLQGENIAFPVNQTRIQCWRDNPALCTVFTANIRLPAEPSDISGMAVITDVLYYDITGWYPDHVEARNMTVCRDNVLTLNWTTQQIYTVSTDLSREGCPILGPLDRPRVATLEGYEPASTYFEQRRTLLDGISNSPLPRIRSLLTGSPAPDPLP